MFVSLSTCTVVLSLIGGDDDITDDDVVAVVVSFVFPRPFSPFLIVFDERFGSEKTARTDDSTRTTTTD
jgi:hypothetical protein